MRNIGMRRGLVGDTGQGGTGRERGREGEERIWRKNQKTSKLVNVKNAIKQHETTYRHVIIHQKWHGIVFEYVWGILTCDAWFSTSSFIPCTYIYVHTHFSGILILAKSRSHCHNDNKWRWHQHKWRYKTHLIFSIWYKNKKVKILKKLKTILFWDKLINLEYPSSLCEVLYCFWQVIPMERDPQSYLGVDISLRENKEAITDIVEIKTKQHFWEFSRSIFDEYRMRIVVLSGQENGVPV